MDNCIKNKILTRSTSKEEHAQGIISSSSQSKTMTKKTEDRSKSKERPDTSLKSIDISQTRSRERTEIFGEKKKSTADGARSNSSESSQTKTNSRERPKTRSQSRESSMARSNSRTLSQTRERSAERLRMGSKAIESSITRTKSRESPQTGTQSRERPKTRSQSRDSSTVRSKSRESSQTSKQPRERPKTRSQSTESSITCSNSRELGKNRSQSKESPKASSKLNKTSQPCSTIEISRNSKLSVRSKMEKPLRTVSTKEYPKDFSKYPSQADLPSQLTSSDREPSSISSRSIERSVDHVTSTEQYLVSPTPKRSSRAGKQSTIPSKLNGSSKIRKSLAVPSRGRRSSSRQQGAIHSTSKTPSHFILRTTEPSLIPFPSNEVQQLCSKERSPVSRTSKDSLQFSSPNGKHIPSTSRGPTSPIPSTSKGSPSPMPSTSRVHLSPVNLRQASLSVSSASVPSNLPPLITPRTNYRSYTDTVKYSIGYSEYSSTEGLLVNPPSPPYIRMSNMPSHARLPSKPEGLAIRLLSGASESQASTSGVSNSTSPRLNGSSEESGNRGPLQTCNRVHAAPEGLELRLNEVGRRLSLDTNVPQTEAQENVPNSTQIQGVMQVTEQPPLDIPNDVHRPQETSEVNQLAQGISNNMNMSRQMSGHVENLSQRMSQMQSSQEISERVQPSQEITENVRPSPSMSENIQPSRRGSNDLRVSGILPENIQTPRELSENIQPSPEMSENFYQRLLGSSEPSLPVNIRNSQGITTNLLQSGGISENSHPSRIISENVELPGMHENMQSPTGISENMQPFQATSRRMQHPRVIPENVQPFRGISSNLQSFTGISDIVQPFRRMSGNLQQPRTMSGSVRPHPEMTENIQPFRRTSGSRPFSHGVSGNVQPFQGFSGNMQSRPVFLESIQPSPRVSFDFRSPRGTSENIQPFRRVSGSMQPPRAIQENIQPFPRRSVSPQGLSVNVHPFQVMPGVIQPPRRMSENITPFSRISESMPILRSILENTGQPGLMTEAVQLSPTRTSLQTSRRISDPGPSDEGLSEYMQLSQAITNVLQLDQETSYNNQMSEAIQSPQDANPQSQQVPEARHNIQGTSGEIQLDNQDMTQSSQRLSNS